MFQRNARRLTAASQALALECCHPRCFAPPQDRISSQVPLCEDHMLEVYKANHRAVLAEQKKQNEYALLPMEQDMIPGPCPSCGVAGYLAVSLTERVRCLNANCHYAAWVDEFETLRRRLLFDAAANRSVVYYIKFRDRVKIGTTNNLKRRWNQIVTAELLYGFEDGDVRLEHRRHRQFAQYRTVGEWFEDNAQIRAHVNNVCSLAA